MKHENINSAGNDLAMNPHRRLAPERLESLQSKAETAIEWIQTNGTSLRQCALKLDIPMNVLLRFIEQDTRLLDHYSYAMEERTEILVEAMLEKASDRSNDMYEDEKGNLKPNPVAVQRDRLITDRMQWYIGAVSPKKYGNRINVEANVQHTQPLSIDQVNDILKQLDSNTIDITPEQG